MANVILLFFNPSLREGLHFSDIFGKSDEEIFPQNIKKTITFVKFGNGHLSYLKLGFWSPKGVFLG